MRPADAITGGVGITTTSFWRGDDAHEATGNAYWSQAHFTKIDEAKQALADLPYKVEIGLFNNVREIRITLTKSIAVPVETTRDGIIAAARGIA
jgi:hypothetical protein